MEEELSFLRRKVNRLEDMIFNINDKIGLILEKFLNHRASHVAGIREVLQVEEDICLSLVTQLKSCIISSSNKDRNSSSTTNNTRAATQARSTTRSAPARQQQAAPSPKKLVPGASFSVPRVVLTRQSVAKQNPVTTTTRQHAEKRRRTITEEEDDPLKDGDPNPNMPNFTINIKAEQTDINFQREDDGHGELGELQLGQVGDEHSNDQGQGSEYEPSKSSDDEDSDRDDPDFTTDAGHLRPRSSSGETKAKTAADPNARSKKSYVLSRTFTSLEEAREIIKAEGEFRYHTKVYTATGTKHYFKCRWARYGTCLTMTPYLMINEVTGGVDEYVSPDPPQHTHRQRIDRRSLGGLAPEVKAVLDDIFLRPRGSATPMNVEQIHEELIRRGFEGAVVPKHKINNYLGRLKKMRFGDLSFMKRRKPAAAKAKATSSAAASSRQGQDRQKPGRMESSQRAGAIVSIIEGGPLAAGPTS